MESKVIIITLNFNQNQYTLDCINTLLKSDYQNFQVLLIDNGSTKENTNDFKKRLPEDKRIIFHEIYPNRGYVGGINYGLAEAAKLNNDYFLIMNNDTIIDKKAISELVSTCRRYNDKAVVTGKVYHYDEPNKIQDVGYYFKDKKYLFCNRIGVNEVDNGQFDEECERDLIDDVFWLFPYKLYKEIGGYSNYFWFNNEQADFALRSKMGGYILVYTSQAKLWHKGSLSIGGRDFNPAMVYWTIQASLIYRYLHLSKGNFSKYYFKTVFSILRTFVKSIFLRFKGINRFKYAYAKYKGLTYFNKWLFVKNKNTGYNPFA